DQAALDVVTLAARNAAEHGPARRRAADVGRRCGPGTVLARRGDFPRRLGLARCARLHGSAPEGPDLVRSRRGRLPAALAPTAPGRQDVMPDRPLYMISVAAELVGMHPQTLRIYEQRGLVRPS